MEKCSDVTKCFPLLLENKELNYLNPKIEKRYKCLMHSTKGLIYLLFPSFPKIAHLMILKRSLTCSSLLIKGCNCQNKTKVKYTVTLKIITCSLKC